MRACGRADAVKGFVDIGHPIAQGFVHRVFQGARAGRDRNDFRAEQFHAEDVRLLTLDIRLAHENDAFQAKARTHGGRRNAVLSCACFGDDAGLAHAHGKQNLTETIIDLVRAGMVQLVAFEIDLGFTIMLGDPLSKIKRAWTADIMRPEIIHLRFEGRVFLGRFIFSFKIEDQRHQRLSDIAPAKIAKAACIVWILVPIILLRHRLLSPP